MLLLGWQVIFGAHTVHIHEFTSLLIGTYNNSVFSLKGHEICGTIDAHKLAIINGDSKCRVK